MFNPDNNYEKFENKVWLSSPTMYPDSMRYALESLGMLAVKMVPDCFGFDILWSDGKSIPQYYLLVGGLLTK